MAAAVASAKNLRTGTREDELYQAVSHLGGSRGGHLPQSHKASALPSSLTACSPAAGNPLAREPATLCVALWCCLCCLPGRTRTSVGFLTRPVHLSLSSWIGHRGKQR